MPLSTAQVRTLRAVKAANDNNGRGLIPPNGPSSRPFKTLVTQGLLTRAIGSALHHLTPQGRKALEQVDNGK